MTLFNLDHILNLEKWQSLQDSLANVTQLAIITINYKGNPVTDHSRCTPFCEQIRSNPDFAKMCQKCDSRAGLEAVRSNRPYIYFCHYKIIDIAVPITIDDKYVGAIMAGQVKPVFNGDHVDLEQILYSSESICSLRDDEALYRLYEEIPNLEYDVILKVSDMLFELCNYIVKEAIDKNSIKNMYNSKRSFSQDGYLDESGPAELPFLNALLDESFSANPLHSIPFATPKNKKLQPALEYIYNNTHLMVSLEKAAQLCHLSPGYFSRCFTKEFGSNYTAYVNHLKVEWAKEMLSQTDTSVTQISDQLGFSDPGYFTKIFKKQEYVTPTLYRKYAPAERNLLDKY